MRFGTLTPEMDMEALYFSDTYKEKCWTEMRSILLVKELSCKYQRG